MNVQTDTTSVPDTATETRTINDAIDLVRRARSLNELMFMAGENLSAPMKEAITTGCDLLDGLLGEVRAILYANSDEGRVQ